MNTLAILTATVAGMSLGVLWYSPLAFGRAWLQAIGKTEEELSSPLVPMLGSILSCLATAIALASIIALAGIATLSEGVALGAVIGLGIVFTALLSDNLFCGWGWKLLLIQSGYRVVYIVVMAAIIAAWPA